MEKRKLGRTGHMSTVAIFGAALLGGADEAITGEAVRLIEEYGINHLDIAPSYGKAEKLMGPYIPQLRDKVFIRFSQLITSIAVESFAGEAVPALLAVNPIPYALWSLLAVFTAAGALGVVAARRYRALAIPLHGKRRPWAPSAKLDLWANRHPRRMTETMLSYTLRAFEESARRAVALGFDAVELQAAQGYLLSQFLSPLTNHRGDPWGGDLEGRLRFPLAVIERVKRVLQGRPLLVKMNIKDADTFSILASIEQSLYKIFFGFNIKSFSSSEYIGKQAVFEHGYIVIRAINYPALGTVAFIIKYNNYG